MAHLINNIPARTRIIKKTLSCMDTKKENSLIKDNIIKSMNSLYQKETSKNVYIENSNPITPKQIISFFA